jgi:hypothetical protein
MAATLNEVQARAAVLASEQTLLGLGAGTLASSLLTLWLPPSVQLPLLELATTAGAVLLACGWLAGAVAWLLDWGRLRSESGPGSVVAVLAASALAACAAAAWSRGQLGAHGVAAGIPALRWAVGCAVVVLAAGGLRALGAATTSVILPTWQLAQASGHALLGGWSLLLLMALASHTVAPEHRFFASVALCVGAAQTVLVTAWLQRHSGLRLYALDHRQPWPRPWRQAHRIASVGLLAGLVVPALIVLVSLQGGYDKGLALACAAVAASYHPLRYAAALANSAVPAPSFEP